MKGEQESKWDTDEQRKYPGGFFGERLNFLFLTQEKDE